MVQIAEAFVYTNVDSSDHYATKALAFAEEAQLIQEQLGALGFLGLGLINKGNLPKALELGLKALESISR